MKYSPLGKTGVNVSAIGFGTVAFGDDYGTVSLEDCRRALMHAIDAGINVVDTSPYYGRTLSEERLGAALDGRRHEVVLGTKCGRYGFDQFDFSEKAVVRGLEDSLRRLKTDHVDILQAHDVEFGSIDQVIHETVPALQRLKEQGKVRFIGVTGYWPHILAHIAEVASVDIVLNYCHWNLMMDDMDAALTPVAERKQLGLMNGSPLHMGLLGGNGGPAWHPAPTNIKTVAARFAALCRDYGTDPAILALNACFQHPSVATTFVGPRNIEEVNDALQALEFQPSTDLLAKVSELLAPTFNTTWPSGLPENQPLRDVLSGQTVGAFSRVGSLRT